MAKSRYLERVVEAKIPLRGNRLIVEFIPKEELKTKGGLYVASALHGHRTDTDMNRADVAIVLQTGPGYFNADGGDEPMDLKPGNVVLLSRFGLRAFSDFPGIRDYVADSIALCRDSDVHAAWDSVESFEAYKAVMAKDDANDAG